MEEDIHHKTLPRGVQERVAKRLTAAIGAAQEALDTEAASNSEILYALDIVKAFLKRKQRVCYGGTAMNAILPPAKRFYDPHVDLPDYDFFTPQLEEDVKELVADLRDAGFSDVYHRVGMHEGTKKILVNFVPIADLSAIAPSIYTVFHKRAYVREGIYYTDPDMLRMMMYLELSRPRGEVNRWEKVYERLQLINRFFPASQTLGISRRVKATTKRRSKDTKITRAYGIVFDYLIEQSRVLLSGSLDAFYTSALKGKARFNTNLQSQPVAFLSSSVHEDAKRLKRLLEGTLQVQMYHYDAKGEIVPEHIELRSHTGNTLAVIFHEMACHSYIPYETTDGRSISIASPDTLVTIYSALSLFTSHLRKRFPSMLRSIPTLIHVGEQARIREHETIPAFPIQCKGYQKGYTTLVREKVARIQREKQARPVSKTRKRSKSETSSA